MEYYEEKDKIVLKNQKEFNIKQILECGQSFRFGEISENTFYIIAHKRIINVCVKEDTIEFFPCNKKDFEEIWVNYFDLNRDYGKIKSIITKNDLVMTNCSKYGSGIRILNQDKWEILITFIISQNNRIPMIKKVIKNISEKYGEYIGKNPVDGNDVFSFPTCEQLKNVTVDELLEQKCGFRSKYIVDAIEKVYNKTIDLEELKNLSTDEVKKALLSIKGVGPKVSDCVILFGFGRWEAFPVDVWIKRVVEYYYFDQKNMPIDTIEKFGKEKFGEYSGIAQQYLFYNAREEQIGK